MQSHVFHVLGFFATLGAAIAAFPKIWQAVKWMLAMLRRLDQLSHLGPVIVGMALQFEKNGGKSMKDAIETLKLNVGGLKDDFDALKTQTNGQDVALAALSTDFASLKKEVERMIAHTAAGDFYESDLRKELEKKLREQQDAAPENQP